MERRRERGPRRDGCDHVRSPLSHAVGHGDDDRGRCRHRRGRCADHQHAAPVGTARARRGRRSAVHHGAAPVPPGQPHDLSRLGRSVAHHRRVPGSGRLGARDHRVRFPARAIPVQPAQWRSVCLAHRDERRQSHAGRHCRCRSPRTGLAGTGVTDVVPRTIVALLAGATAYFLVSITLVNLRRASTVADFGRGVLRTAGGKLPMVVGNMSLGLDLRGAVPRRIRCGCCRDAAGDRADPPDVRLPVAGRRRAPDLARLRRHRPLAQPARRARCRRRRGPRRC